MLISTTVPVLNTAQQHQRFGLWLGVAAQPFSGKELGEVFTRPPFRSIFQSFGRGPGLLTSSELSIQTPDLLGLVSTLTARKQSPFVGLYKFDEQVAVAVSSAVVVSVRAPDFRNSTRMHRAGFSMLKCSDLGTFLNARPLLKEAVHLRSKENCSFSWLYKYKLLTRVLLVNPTGRNHTSAK